MPCPQLVTRRGKETAVVLSIEEWKRLQGLNKPTLKDLLFADFARADFEIPRIGNLLDRPQVIF